MSATPGVSDRRAERHLQTRGRILAAAWALARDRGLAGWSLRDVAVGVGMRAPSLYVYFDSKNALFDAMFAEGYRALLVRIEATRIEATRVEAARIEATRIDAMPTDGQPAPVLRLAAHLFFDFAVEDPARFQLLFLRTLPGFAPSAESYALAQSAIAALAEVLRGAGAGSPEQVDLWTAVFTGLASQQISNDPGGDRWHRLVDVAVDLLTERRASLPAN